MTFDKPIIITKFNEKTEQFEEYIRLHARINKASGNEKYNAGAEFNSQTLNFDVRYNAKVKPLRLNLQIYRVIYDNVQYNLKDYDDFMEQHQVVRLVGDSIA